MLRPGAGVLAMWDSAPGRHLRQINAATPPGVAGRAGVRWLKPRRQAWPAWERSQRSAT